MRFPFTVAEEIFVFGDRPSQPQTGCIELHVTGTLDEQRLRDAVAAAVMLHPMAQARQASARRGLRPSEWEIADTRRMNLNGVVRVMAADDDDEMPAIRARFSGEPISLGVPPALRLLLIHRPAGDSLIFKWHHSIADGIGAIRFLISVRRAYVDAPDPIPDVDPIAVRDVTIATSAEEPARRAGAAPAEKRAERPLKMRDLPTLVAPENPASQPGYGIHYAELSIKEIQLEDLRARLPAVGVNDVLIGALHLAITEWNRMHGEASGRIIVLMPVSLRPAAWLREVVANVVGHGVVVTTADQRADRFTLMDVICRQTRTLRDNSLSAALNRPRWARRIAPLVLALLSLRPLSRRQQVAAFLSNVGRMRGLADFGPAGAVTMLTGTMPASMPPGLALTTGRFNDSMQIGLRHNRLLLDDAAATRFLRLYLDEVRYLCAGVAIGSEHEMERRVHAAMAAHA